jgi:DNA-binding response OmpR family regulator
MARKSPPDVESPVDQLHILVIDNDKSLRAQTAKYLAEFGFKVDFTCSGCTGVQRASLPSWHAIILDVNLSDMHWIDVLRKIRSFSKIPIVLTASALDEASCIAALNSGADEYLPKNISQPELVARLRAVVRRAGWTAHESPVPVINEVVVGPLRLRLGSYTAFFGERALNLTRTEFDVLLVLARAGGKVCTREELVESSTGGVWQVFDRGIDMHISALRRALGDESREPRYIRTIRGVGYVLTMPDFLEQP